MNSTADNTATVDDIAIRFNEPQTDDREMLDEGAYMAVLKGFQVVDKPQWAIDSEQKRYPNKTVDTQQWEWQFQLTDEGFEDVVMTVWTTRTFGTPDSPHKAKARIFAAKLLGKSDLDGTEQTSTKQLIGRPIELYITRGEKRNFVDAAQSRPVAPKPRPQRPQRPQAAPQVQLDGYPQDEEEIPF